MNALQKGVEDYRMQLSQTLEMGLCDLDETASRISPERGIWIGGDQQVDAIWRRRE